MTKKYLIDYGIRNKKVLIVGGTRDLGKEISLQLLKSGCKVSIIGRNKNLLNKTINYFKKLKLKNLVGYAADVSSEKETNQLIEKFRKEKINFDIIVYNAGSSAVVKNSLASREDFKKVWNLNLGAAVAFNQFAAPYMKRKKWGRIVHVSSVSAINFSGYTAYVAAKSAVHGYVKSVSRHLAKENIIISAVCPGPMKLKGRYLSNIEKKNKKEWKDYVKNHLPIGRLATQAEVVNTILFLCSRLASYCSGSIFTTDGSYHY
tara:strand:- start:841 stop:1623 length:783 start_codon:yes stop_codon:yes gene_type:complete